MPNYPAEALSIRDALALAHRALLDYARARGPKSAPGARALVVARDTVAPTLGYVTAVLPSVRMDANGWTENGRETWQGIWRAAESAREMIDAARLPGFSNPL